MELRPGAPADSDIRILFAVEPPGTALLIAVLEGRDAVQDHYREAVRIDPSNPNIVYAALWQQQQSFIEGGSFGGSSPAPGLRSRGSLAPTRWRPLP